MFADQARTFPYPRTHQIYADLPAMMVLTTLREANEKSDMPVRPQRLGWSSRELQPQSFNTSYGGVSVEFVLAARAR